MSLNCFSTNLIQDRPPRREADRGAIPEVIWIYASVLVLWGNLASSLLGTTSRLPGGSVEFALAGAALVGLSLAFARALGLDAAALGLDRVGFARAAAVGAALGLAGAMAAVGALRLVAPAIVGQPVEYAPLAQVTELELARHVAVLLPLGTVMPEEFAFRGVLLGGLLRRLRQRDALIFSGAAFALWHLGVAMVTVDDTTLGSPSPWFALAVVVALAVVLLGGSALAWIRIRTRSLATTIALHWLFNAGLLLGLSYTRVPAECCR
jgi:Predicted metal-dependent membrane protease